MNDRTGTSAPSTRAGPNHAAQVVTLLLLALVASWPSLFNGFAYDDVPLILENARVHAGNPFWSYLGQDYWPAHGDALYRPVTVWLFSVQWALGGGAPWVFHATSLALYLGTVLCLFLVGRRILPAWAAWLAAALFAVHPVHVEAVANVVGQSELHVGLATMLALWIYLRGRDDGMPARSRVALALLACWAALAKEHGFLLPVALLWLEMVLPADRAGLSDRLRRNGSLWILLAITTAALLLLRWSVLGGPGGGAPAVALEGASPGQRFRTMLGIVPHWARLLVWPNSLAADYSPPGVDLATSFGAAQVAGTVILLLAVGIGLASLRGHRVATFGLGWVALWLLPVSNLVFPTGILLAERTLYLPSVGMVLAVAAWAGALRGGTAPQPLRLAGAGVALLALVGGAVRSAQRHPVWMNNDRLFRQTLQDAPDHYRAHWLWARHLESVGRLDEAVASLRVAVELYQRDPVAFEDLGHLERLRGRCTLAVDPLRRALALDSTRVVARSRLVQCLIRTRDFEEARTTAAGGLALGDSAYVEILAEIDSLRGFSRLPE